MVNEERYLKALKIIKNNFELHLSPKSKNLKYAEYVFINDIFKEIDESVEQTKIVIDSDVKDGDS